MTRKADGAAMTLLIIVLVFVLLMILGGLWALVQLTIASQRNYTAVEAASLAASEDLSRIVIDDPYFGKISLSDYPPTGKATLGRDGELLLGRCQRCKEHDLRVRPVNKETPSPANRNRSGALSLLLLITGNWYTFLSRRLCADRSSYLRLLQVALKMNA